MIFAPLYELVVFLFLWGLVSKWWRKASQKNDDVKQKKIIHSDVELDLRVIRNRVDWAAYEAEIASLRSEAMMRKLSELESEILKIKEYMATALEVSVELDRKLGEKVIVDRKITEKKIKERQDAREAPAAGSKFSSTEEQVIELLSSSKGMVARDIQLKINMSREHVSRLLGRLVGKGILLRVRRGRQFVYQLQEQTKTSANQQ